MDPALGETLSRNQAHFRKEVFLIQQSPGKNVLRNKKHFKVVFWGS